MEGSALMSMRCTTCRLKGKIEWRGREQKIRNGEHVRCRVLDGKMDEKRFWGGGRDHIKYHIMFIRTGPPDRPPSGRRGYKQ